MEMIAQYVPISVFSLTEAQRYELLEDKNQAIEWWDILELQNEAFPLWLVLQTRISQALLLINDSFSLESYWVKHEAGARFLKVLVTLQARSYILKSKSMVLWSSF